MKIPLSASSSNLVHRQFILVIVEICHPIKSLICFTLMLMLNRLIEILSLKPGVWTKIKKAFKPCGGINTVKIMFATQTIWLGLWQQLKDAFTFLQNVKRFSIESQPPDHPCCIKCSKESTRTP